MTTEATKTGITTIRILKEDTCSSSSGKSNLTYQIGCNEKNEIQFRVSKNSGNGFFSGDFKSLKSIMALLNESQYPITGATLQPLYNRLSNNSSYFLLVCLLNEGIVERWKRIYKLTDIEPFMTKMKGLMASKDDKKVTPKKKKIVKPVQEKAS
jgi:hypothetical protein